MAEDPETLEYFYTPKPNGRTRTSGINRLHSHATRHVGAPLHNYVVMVCNDVELAITHISTF